MRVSNFLVLETVKREEELTMFIHEASEFIRCMFRVHQMFPGDLWGKFWLFIWCFLSVEGSIKFIIEKSRSEVSLIELDTIENVS